jgi:peptidyl-prolyl cis-trans isomerase D
MAVLERIRSRAGTIVVIVIGLALVSFVLQDLFSSGNSIFRGGANTIGEINGNSISGEEFASRLNAAEEKYKRNQNASGVDENVRQQLINDIWNEYLDQYLFDKELNGTGVNVAEDELFDMVQGENVDPQVQQIPLFQDSITRQFDRNRVIRFLKTQLSEENDPDGKFRESWSDFEQSLMKARRKAKYNNLIKKAMYVTTAQAKNSYNERGRSVTYRMVGKSYDSLADSLVKISDDDYKKYYDEHKHELEQQDETRKLEYVVFQVNPTPEDRAELMGSMEQIKTQFQAATNDTAFANANSSNGFREESVKRGSLNIQIDSAVFAGTPGTVYGPFVDGNDVKVVKLRGFKSVSDSVKARHILISTQKGITEIAAMAKADSLKKVIQAGGDFAALATLLSDDPGSKIKGGDLGFFPEGAMVPEFNNACFNGKVGDMVVVKTQFGAHLINIQDKTKPTNKASLVFISRPVEASNKTNEAVFNSANDFAVTAENYEAFKKKADEKKIFIVKANSIRPTDRQVNDLANSRELVTWAFNEETDLNTVTKVLELDGKYVVAALTGKRDKGVPPLDQVKEDIEPLVKRMKKGEIFEKELALAGATTIDAFAARVKLNVDAPNSVNFASYSLPNYGYEPKLAGTIPYSKINVLNGPVRGNAGVFVYVVETITEAPPMTGDIKDLKRQLIGSSQGRVDMGVYTSLQKKAGVEDKRYRFF